MQEEYDIQRRFVEEENEKTRQFLRVHCDEACTAVNSGQTRQITIDPASQVAAVRHDCTDDEWLTEFRAASVAVDTLPAIASSSDFLQQELPVKISLTSKVLETWSSVLSPALRNRIFASGEHKTCKAIKRLLVQMLECSPGDGQSTTSYIWFWDSIIRRVLQLVLHSAKVERDSSELPTKGKLRPDFMLFLDGVCVLRGWEQGPNGNVDIGRRVLESKTPWIFGDQVPYVFGYVALGEIVRLLAFTRQDSETTTHLLGQYDLNHHGQHLQLFLALLNLCRVIPSLASASSEFSRREFVTVQRSDDVVLRMNATCCEKWFLKHDSDRMGRLQRISSTLSQLNVRSTYRIVKVESNMTVFKPRGSQR